MCVPPEQDRAELRRQTAADVLRFMAEGGEIRQVPFGASGEKTKGRTRKRSEPLTIVNHYK